MNPEFVKNLEIIFVLSPFFLSVFTLGWLVNKGLNKLQTYSLYWLFGLILLCIFLTYGIFTENMSSYSALIGILATSVYWKTYLKLRKKGK